ncbi:hypothetical protein [Tabrizicola sp.]|uniref:hypothetical protein n=1 Tax=Tabrizicola sp. TaxID=2005166 RepID=UPI0035B00E6A
MSFEFPTATYVFPMEDFVAADTRPTNSGEMGLVVDFNTNFPQSFGPFTAGVVGQTGTLRICGEEVSRILVQSEIGGMTIPLALERPDDAERLADILNARSCGLDADS